MLGVSRGKVKRVFCIALSGKPISYGTDQQHRWTLHFTLFVEVQVPGMMQVSEDTVLNYRYLPNDSYVPEAEVNLSILNVG